MRGLAGPLKLTLDYGRAGLAVDIPDVYNARVLDVEEASGVPDPIAAVTASLDNPIDSPPLAEVADGRRSACIVVSDKTRPVPNRLLLPPILDVLRAGNVKATILIACGMHSPTIDEELRELLGDDVLASCDVINHDGPAGDAVVNLGAHDAGGDILVNKTYMESDLKILTGFIEPHFMAGFSGGRKSVCPGIVGLRTMQHAHSPALLESPRSAPGVLDHNPVHEFMLDVARRAGVDFILNVTLNRNKDITGVFAGDMEAAHLAGVEHCRRHCRCLIASPVDIVVTTNGGYPLDQNFYQTVKGMVGALDILRPGGTIIIASECSKGLGSEAFRDQLWSMTDREEFIRTISRPGCFRVDQWGVETLVQVLRKADVKLYSTGLSPEDARRSHVEPVDNVEQAVEDAARKHGPGASIAVVPSGPFILAQVHS